jgi:hypothetical protein
VSGAVCNSVFSFGFTEAALALVKAHPDKTPIVTALPKLLKTLNFLRANRLKRNTMPDDLILFLITSSI